VKATATMRSVNVQLYIDGDMFYVDSRKYIVIKSGDGDVVYMTSGDDGIWMVIHY
jgi:hypothetical protein